MPITLLRTHPNYILNTDCLLCSEDAILQGGRGAIHGGDILSIHYISIAYSKIVGWIMMLCNEIYRSVLYDNWTKD